MTKAAELAALIGSQTALSHRNLVINGAMNVAQRGTSSTGLGASSGYFTVDRFQMVLSGTAGRFTMSQAAVTDLPGFANAMKLDCTTADTSIAAAEVFEIQQPIEGQNLQQLKKGTSSAESVTVSFYMKTNKAFTFMAELDDTDNNRVNTQQFTTTTGWTRHSITFAGDTTGTLDDDNAVSLRFNIFVHAGSNFTGGTYSANTWQSRASSDNMRAVGIGSFFDSTDNEIQLTGLQIEIGETATAFEHRTFADDLAACQRYFQKSYDYGTDIGTATTVGAMFHRHTASDDVSNRTPNITFPVEMRAATTTVVYSLNGTSAAASDCGTGFTHSSDVTSTNFSGTDGTHGLSRLGLGQGKDAIIGFHYTADAEL